MLCVALVMSPIVTACESVSDVTGVGQVLSFECRSRPYTGKTRIMIMDFQFNPDVPQLAGKVAGCYQIGCDKDDHCSVSSGVTLDRTLYSRSSPHDPAAWNRDIAAKRLPDGLVDRLEDPYFGVGPDSDHGTATAAIARYAAPDVELVLVQTPLRKRSERVECPAPEKFRAELDDARAARDATIALPATEYEKALLDVIRREHVSVIHQSFGSSRTDLERLCPGLPWGEYLQLDAETKHERNARLDASGAFDGVAVTVVQSAGNEGLEAQSAADEEYCIDDSGFGARSERIIVGAYDPSRAELPRSSFSNFGRCVHVFAPGENIAAPDARGILRTEDGTSAAAPLVSRLIASRIRAGSTAGNVRRELTALARDRTLPLELFPAGALFSDKTTPYEP